MRLTTWKDIFIQIKKRKLWQTLIGYPAAAFALLQAVDFFITRFGWNPKLLVFSLILLLGGLPIALIWNWKHGLVGDQAFLRSEWVTYANISLIALSAAVLYWIYGQLPNSEDPPTDTEFLRVHNSANSSVRRLHLNLPADKAMYQERRTALALSPDGRQLAYVGFNGRRTQIFIRSLDAYEVKALPGTEGAQSVFFSPDGGWLGFVTENSIRKIRVDGEMATTLCEVSYVWGACWGPNDLIAFGNLDGFNLSYISASGGPVTALKMRGFLPSFLPDGDHLLANNFDSIVVINIRTRKRKALNIKGVSVPAGSPKYLASGHIAFAQSGQLFVVPFDVEQLEVTGPTVPVLTDLRTERVREAGQFTCSENGTLVYASGGAVTMAHLAWLDKKGNHTLLPFAPQKFGSFALSPDKSQLAVIVNEVQASLWIYDLSSQRRMRLTDKGDVIAARWSKDGQSVFVFGKIDGPTRKLYRADLGGGTLQLLAEGHYHPYAISPDGKSLLVGRNDLKTRRFDLKYHLVEAADFLPEVNSWGMSFSPNEQYVAYQASSQGSGFQIFVRRYPPTAERWQISETNGEVPLWSPDGKKLYFRNVGISKIFEVDITYEPEFRVNKPRLLIETISTDVPGKEWAISEDGERFLVLDPVRKEQTTTSLRVVENWFDEIESIFKDH